MWCVCGVYMVYVYMYKRVHIGAYTAMQVYKQVYKGCIQGVYYGAVSHIASTYLQEMVVLAEEGGDECGVLRVVLLPCVDRRLPFLHHLHPGALDVLLHDLQR